MNCLSVGSIVLRHIIEFEQLQLMGFHRQKCAGAEIHCPTLFLIRVNTVETSRERVFTVPLLAIRPWLNKSTRSRVEQKLFSGTTTTSRKALNASNSSTTEHSS